MLFCDILAILPCASVQLEIIDLLLYCEKLYVHPNWIPEARSIFVLCNMIYATNWLEKDI